MSRQTDKPSKTGRLISVDYAKRSRPDPRLGSIQIHKHTEGGIFEATLRPSDRTSDRASDRAIDGSTERSSDRAGERPSDRAAERSSDRATDDRESDRASDRAIDGDRKSSSRSPFDTLTSALWSIFSNSSF